MRLFMIKDKKKQLFILGYFVFYILWKIIAPQNITDKGSSLILLSGILGASLLMFSISGKSGDYKNYAILIATALLMYFVGDCTWIAYEWFVSPNVPVVHISSMFYLMDSFLFCVGIWSVVIKESTRWSRSQSGVDGVISATFILYIIWKLIFSKLISSDSPLNAEEYILITYVSFDFMVILAISMLSQSRKSKFPDKIQSIALITWSVTDIFYYWSVLTRNYDASSYIDIFWVMSYLMIWYSLDYRVSKNQIKIEKIENASKSENIGKKTPLSLIILFVMSFVLSYDNIFLMLFFSLLVMLRKLSSKYIYTYIINEHLTKEYKKLNEILEEKVIERTEELNEKNQELYILANIDELTSLPNRRSFLEYFQYKIESDRNHNLTALLFIDLDRFKSINDWYGHELGDKLLICTCERLKENLPDNSFLARLGGDEFVVVLNHVSGKEDALEKALDLVGAFKNPFDIEESKINSTISIGISVYPLHGAQVSDLLRSADMALYSAKRAGKNTAIVYDLNMKKEEKLKLETESKLYDSIKNNEFEILYRPYMRTCDEKPAGIKAELYWNNPKLGLIPYSDFKMIAQDNGFAIDIGVWLINEACKKIKYFKEICNMEKRISIEISTKQFLGSDIVYEIEKSINKYAIKSSCLEMEIVEKFSLKDEKIILEKFGKLKALGIRISIIDVGAGYSSLKGMIEYPIDSLKIAPSIISNIDSDVLSCKVAEAIICFSKIFSLNTIAEGVENNRQFELLKHFGCDEIQGDYYGKPINFEEVEALLKSLV